MYTYKGKEHFKRWLVEDEESAFHFMAKQICDVECFEQLLNLFVLHNIAQHESYNNKFILDGMWPDLVITQEPPIGMNKFSTKLVVNIQNELFHKNQYFEIKRRLSSLTQHALDDYNKYILSHINKVALTKTPSLDKHMYMIIPQSKKKDLLGMTTSILQYRNIKFVFSQDANYIYFTYNNKSCLSYYTQKFLDVQTKPRVMLSEKEWHNSIIVSMHGLVSMIESNPLYKTDISNLHQLMEPLCHQ